MALSENQFGIEITHLLKERKLTQRELAYHLRVTPATVSYLLHNKLRPSLAHFNGIMEFLKADAPLINSLKTYWRATRKIQEDPSFANDTLFALRCSRGLSLQQVSAATGIPAERLKVLENQPDAAPLAEEAAALKLFYGEEALSGKNELPVSRPSPAVAEKDPPGARSLPLMTVETFARIPAGTTVAKFIGGMDLPCRLRRLGEKLYGRAQAMIVCDSSEVHYGLPGTVELLIGDNTPESRDLLYIGPGARGAVALFRRQRRHLEYFGFASPAPRIAVRAALPVLEFKFTAASEVN